MEGPVHSECDHDDTHWGEVASKADMNLMYTAFGENTNRVAAPMWQELQARDNLMGWVMSDWGTFPYVSAAGPQVRG